MTENPTPHSVIRYWLEEVGPEGWYKPTAALDAQIRARYEVLWQQCKAEDRPPWTGGTPEALASVIVLDQFPRNMFRDKAAAFETDALALRTTREAIAAGLDRGATGAEQQFFYMPFMHCEDLAVQDEGIALVSDRMPGSQTLLHARAHRQIIADFGRFPFRNPALGRTTTMQEQAFLDAGAYGAIVRKLKE